MDAARERAMRERIAELKSEIDRLRAQLPARLKIYERVHALLKAGCNTSQDIADELNMPVHLAAAHLCLLAKRGLARRTGRTIRTACGMSRFVVWEAV